MAGPVRCSYAPVQASEKVPVATSVVLNSLMFAYWLEMSASSDTEPDTDAKVLVVLPVEWATVPWHFELLV